MSKNAIIFDDVSGQDFDALPEDRYVLECINAELTKSKADNLKIATSFKIIDGYFKNRRLWHDFSLVQTALFNLKNYFEAAGIDTAGKKVEPEDLPALLKNTQVSGYVVKTIFDGKPGNKITNWAPANASATENELFT